MKCRYEKAIETHLLKTKSAMAGANAVIDEVLKYFTEQRKKFPKEKQKELTIGVDDFVKFMEEVRAKIKSEMGED